MIRYITEKAKYEETLKQKALTSPHPVASLRAESPLSQAAPAEAAATPGSPGLKKKKDADAPKRPRTAYILFSMEFRKTLDQSVSFNDGTKLVSAGI